MAAPLLINASVLTDAPGARRETLRRPSDEEVALHLRRYDTLKSQRSVFDTHWQLVAELVWPDWADFTSQREQGERRTTRQFDSTAAYALERFAAVLETFLTPRAQKWHELRATHDELNKDVNVKRWFDDASRILHEQRSKPESGFYGAMQVAYKSHGAFGNAGVAIEPNRRGGIGYHSRHIKDLCIAHNDQGKVDTVYECYTLSLRAAALRFGDDLPQVILDRAKASPYDKTMFVRAIFPTPDHVPGKLDSRPFTSLDIHHGEKKLVGVGSFFELPVVYSRYTLNPSEDYGRGPAMVSLADNLTLQEMEKTHLRAGELIAYPPLLLPSDGPLGVGGTTVDLRGGALNMGGLDSVGNELVKPLLTGGRIDVTFEMMQQKRQNIRSAMLLDLFEILAQNPQMTATQAMLVAQERGVITAPIVGRLQQEMLGPIIHRELGLALRMGLLPPMPRALAEVRADYRIDYTGPATRSQRIEELVGITRTIEIAAPWIQSDPSYLEVLDGEKVMRLAAEVTGVPSAVVRSEEELAAVRRAQAAASQEQQALAQLPELAKAAQSAAGAAKDLQAAPNVAKEIGGIR